MSAAAISILFLFINQTSAAFGQPPNTMPLSSARVLPPAWHIGDRWTVVMKTLAPAPAEMRPRYAEHTYEFRVRSIPSAPASTYSIEIRPQGTQDGPLYTMYFRETDFSVEKVTRRSGTGEPEQVLLASAAGQPFIYYERRLPLIPDFLVAGPDRTQRHSELQAGTSKVVQDIDVRENQAHIRLERIEPLGSLRVTMDWNAGHPWWSSIECTENPPPGLPFKGRVVASGYLVSPSLPSPK